MSDDKELVAATISHYLDGVRTGNRSDFNEAFAEGATVTHRSMSEASVETSSLDSFVELVQGLLKEHGSLEETLDGLDIQVKDTIGTARAAFTLTLGDQQVTGDDVFSLAKVSDRWLITHKLYSM